MVMIAAIMADYAGRPQRAAAFREAMAAAGVQAAVSAPADSPQPHAATVKIPEAWLPVNGLPLARRQWWRHHTEYLAAWQARVVGDPEYVWCVESDVLANAATWARLVQETAEDPADGLFLSLTGQTGMAVNGWLGNPATPGWMTHQCLGAVCRLSRRALRWLTDSAEETREAFGEVTLPSTIIRGGGTIGDINVAGPEGYCGVGQGRWFYNRLTMTAPPREPVLDARLLNHPYKADGPLPLRKGG